jgi:hypothetical protein
LCIFQGKKIELKNNIGWQVFIAQGAKVDWPAELKI